MRNTNKAIYFLTVKVLEDHIHYLGVFIKDDGKPAKT